MTSYWRLLVTEAILVIRKSLIPMRAVANVDETICKFAMKVGRRLIYKSSDSEVSHSDDEKETHDGSNRAETFVNPYPLEGKYSDAADRSRHASPKPRMHF